MSSLTTAITGTATSLLAMYSGAIAGTILGGAAFIITDLVASAITGAIERKELNEAIDALKNLKAQIDPSLSQAATKLAGVTQAIKDGLYRLDDKHILVKNPDGSYMIIETGAANARLLSNVPQDGILFLSA